MTCIDAIRTLSVLLPLAACQLGGSATEPPPREHTRSAHLFGTRFELRLAGPDAAALDAAASAALAEGERLEALVSGWVEGSGLMRFNDSARVAGRFEVTPELARLVEQAQSWCHASGGAVDPTVGALLELYGYYDGGGAAPLPEELATTLERVGCDALRVEGHALVTTVDGVRLDLGAVAKGFTVDRMAALLRAAGVEDAVISAGGSSVLAFGGEPGGVGWPLVVDPGAGPEIWRLRDEAVGISGQLSEPVFVDGRLVSHLIDPRSGLPVDHDTLQVAVRAANATDADLASTALLVLGTEAAAAWLADPAACPSILAVTLTDVARADRTAREIARLRAR
ncbi:FAD:protein FMN transferase [Engelhardtia mirabilis]|uniref:FAD:protein FMN transferase n=1 Tax=Engelhardtia mirabilis TaxID=2528011 RepID=A0A518BDY0_9BACT|nr:Thiamine biosynthesis lipoprotein ApbE precursor [Planctomycetes bacterium Pla133]QDU99521.1 Thiamine biosynthesis lipoprotein ApbE precursor [Planctomycetes bacterium Pla86]